MRKILPSIAVVVSLSVAGTAFGAIVYNAGTMVLDYGNAGDLAAIVDPVNGPPSLDVVPAQQCGIPLPAYNALPPQVVHFNQLPTGPGAPGPVLKIVAHYDSANPGSTVTIDNFQGAAAGTNNALDFGGYANFGPLPTSHLANDPGSAVPGDCDDVFNGGPSIGTRPWVPISPVVPANPGLVWFGCDIACSAPNEYVDSFAFTASGQTGGSPTLAGTAYFLLSDGSYGQVPYVAFGAPNPQTISIAYQAPVGLGILGVDVIAEAGAGGGSCQYCMLDDFGFTVVPEPTTLLLLVGSGVFAVLRKKR